MEQEQQQWRKLTGERIRIQIAEEVANVLIREKEAGHELKVCIGTDSQVKGRLTEFATVIVFIREAKGGFMYIH
ncbi:MAG TPA: ribonuclease H-like YkuK family protein, partial [Chitinophagaceae bacterium]|nr:ribonuclease H-like YkuK family protein [Chitinophagaceae bacterium]